MLKLCIWFHVVAVITSEELYSTKPELRFCAGSNPACSMSEICSGGDLWQWSWLELRRNTFSWSTIYQILNHVMRHNGWLKSLIKKRMYSGYQVSCAYLLWNTVLVFVFNIYLLSVTIYRGSSFQRRLI